MYLTAKAERVKKGMTLEKMSALLGIRIATLSLKLNGKAPLTYVEAKRIKKILGTNLSLEELFPEGA